MAPGSNKRKRPERQTSHDDGSGRPSPHRPEKMGMAQHSYANSPSRHTRGGRRPSRQVAHSSEAVATASSSGSNETPVQATNSSHAHAQQGTPAADISQPATPAPRSMEQPQAPEEETIIPSPYIYEIITDAIVEGWQERGKEVISSAKRDDGLFSSLMLQELVRSALDGRLDAALVGSMLRELLFDVPDTDTSSFQLLFLNTLSLLEEWDTRNPKLLTLLAATNIDPDLIRQELDVPLLQTLALVRSTFERMRTRKTTNLLYRQANFNLLREESEGYAKLITEYFNTANEAVVNPNVSADEAFQRVMALVGSFDLDVGRVLDITLDISANLLVRAYAFFVKFYRCSSWWPENGVLDNVKWRDQGFSSFPDWALPNYDPDVSDDAKQQELERISFLTEERDVQFWARVQEVGMDAFFELGARTIADFDKVQALLETELEPEFDSRNNEINVDRRKRINENRKFMRETGTLPPQGNSDAAQLLGFKLRFYASSARDSADVLPDNLVFLAALLIKIGFISLRDLYPHLYPPDDQMLEERARLEKDKNEKAAKARPGGGVNALAMAGALPDDTVPTIRSLREKERSGGSTPKTEKKDEEPTEELPPPTNQKIVLLKALLLIGALPEALYILGRFPWIAEVDSSLPPYLHRIVRHMLSKVSEATKPLNKREEIQNPKDEIKDTVPSSQGSLRFQDRPTKKITRWLGLDQTDKSDGQTYRHYYPDWEGNIPVCQNIDDVFLLCNTFIGYLGVKIGQDASLFSTLLRIAKYDLTNDDSDANRSRWLELMKRLLVPALSLSTHNPGLSQAVYELLKFFPTETRYNIYAEWYLGKTSRLPDMRVAFDHNKAEVKDVLRRVTNETGKRQARALAKVSFASPGIVMMSMINQLESYSNMIPSLVECTRYFSLLAWDVLTWCLLNSLSGQGRDRIQADGMLTSPWLQALSNFVATLFLRYSIINPTPVLQYLAFELRAGNSTDLEMFEQVLAEMGGIKSDMEFNDAQVLAMAGGEHLQAQIVLQLADKRHARKSSALRLVKALVDHSLAGQTLIAIAQERKMYPHRESSTHMPLKVLGNNLDKIQQIFAQYLEVLRTHMTTADFENAIPSIVSLVSDFGVDPGSAFSICRSIIAGRMNEYDAAKKEESDQKRRRTSQEKSTDKSEAKTVEVTTLTNGEAAKAEPPSDGEVLTDAAEGNVQVAKPTTTMSNTWHPVLEPIIENLSEAAPTLADRVSMPFFVTFWTLALQDILVHTPSYDKEINKLRDQIKQVNSDRSDVSALASKEKERKKKAATEIQDNLRDELKSRIAAYQKTRNRLSRREKDHWFSRSMEKEDIDARHIGLLQECFLPRAMLSSLDAHYCFLMLKILHDNGTPGFSIMHLLHHLLRKQALAALMFQCTAMEAQHFGRFLSETLKLLQHWHADKTIYDKEALGGKNKLPGFAKKLDSKGEPETILEYEEFRRLLFNWHSFLNGALQLCFESGEYMHIRNGIIVLRSIAQVFPALNFMGHNMVKQVTRISEEDSRQDLKLAAMSLLGPLRSREKQWMMPQAFRLNDPTKEGAKGSKGGSARNDAAQSGTSAAHLNAAAPEFKPSNNSAANGPSKKETVAGPEDGEIDEKPAADKAGDTEMKDAPDVSEGGAQESSSNPANATTKTSGSPPPESASGGRVQPASVPKLPARTESPRPSATQPANSRPQHLLPSRPDPSAARKPLPPPPQVDRPGPYPARGEERFGRLDRPSDVRPSSRNHSPTGRSHGRTPDREALNRDIGKGERPQARDDRFPSRSYARDEPQAARRTPAHPSSRDRPNGSMGPPTNHGGQPERASQIGSTVQGSTSDATESTSDPQRSTSQPSTPHHENPARLALINTDQTPARTGSAAAPPPEPRRDYVARQERGPPRADGRGSGRNGAMESPRDYPRSSQHNEAAPTGPRHGRSSRDSSGSHHQESSYGRLNAPSEVLPGPQASTGPPGRGGRNFGGHQQPPLNTQPTESPSSSGGGYDTASTQRSPRQSLDRRTSDLPFDRRQASNSVPSTPKSENGPAVHPSRMSQLSGQSSGADTRSAATPPAAPAGPRGPNRPPAGPASAAPATNASALSNSGNAVDSHGRGDRQRASINATLQNSTPATAPNAPVSFRGAAQNRMPSAPQALPSQPQALASPIEAPPRRGEPQSGRPEPRQDLFQGRPPRGDDESGHGGERHPRWREEERFGRGSRNTSRERRGDEGPPFTPQSDRRVPRDEPRDEHRDRRSGMGRHPRSEGPRPPTETPGSFDNHPPMGPSHGPEWGRSDGRGPREDARRGSGGRGGSRGGSMSEAFRGPPPRWEEERRDPGRGPREEPSSMPQPPPYGTRKRRHDDVPPPFDETKRRRGGQR